MKNLTKFTLFAILITLLAGAGQAEAESGIFLQATRPATRAATRSATSPATGTVPATGSATRTATVTKTPTPAATAAIVVDGGVENLFPMLLRFYVVLRLPQSKLATAKLKIFQAGIIDQTISIPLKETSRALNDVASAIYFPWPLNADNAPLPFAEMSFQWIVEDTDKLTHTSDRLTFEYNDTYQKWSRLTEKPIKLYWHGDLSASFLRGNLIRAYDLLLKNAGVASEYSFIIYEPRAEPCEVDPARPLQKVLVARKDFTVYPCDPKQAAVVYRARGFTFIQRTSLLIEQLQDELITLMAADSYNDLFKKAATASAIPAWFRTGITQLYSLIGRSNSLLLAREQARQDRLLTLEDLAKPAVGRADDFGASIRNWNAQAYTLTLYLAARFGAQAPFQLARAIGDKGTFETAFSTISNGMTLDQFYADWKTWILSPDADAASRWNVYATDPTPTITPTETQYPTFTPFTPLPFPSDTPFATRTPRPSLTPAPTNTARPPGSLDTPTPRATPSPAAIVTATVTR